MMQDVTNFVLDWVHCAHDVWHRWFRAREDGDHDFLSVEDLLLEVLVMEKLGVCGMSREAFFNLIRITFYEEQSNERSIFVEQKSGNLLGKCENIQIEQEVSYPVRSIDPKGTMLDDKPYVEVVVDDRFFLEPFDGATSFKLLWTSSLRSVDHHPPPSHLG